LGWVKLGSKEQEDIRTRGEAVTIKIVEAEDPASRAARS
jgi:hypothetical protein